MPLQTLQEVARELRGMTNLDGDAAVEAALRLQAQLKQSHELAEKVPHVVWHWLADADIRARDAEYGHRQTALLEQAVAEMEATGAI